MTWHTEHHLYIALPGSGPREIDLRCTHCDYRYLVYFPYDVPEWWPGALQVAIDHTVVCVNLPSESSIGG